MWLADMQEEVAAAERSGGILCRHDFFFCSCCYALSVVAVSLTLDELADARGLMYGEAVGATEKNPPHENSRFEALDRLRRRNRG